MNIYDDVDAATLNLFRAYHRDNPWIYAAFKKFAEDMLRAGRKRYSAKSIMERIRWEQEISDAAEDFKINNDFTSIYARVLAHREPEFKNFFEFRTITGLKRAA